MSVLAWQLGTTPSFIPVEFQRNITSPTKKIVVVLNNKKLCTIHKSSVTVQELIAISNAKYLQHQTWPYRLKAFVRVRRSNPFISYKQFLHNEKSRIYTVQSIDWEGEDKVTLSIGVSYNFTNE